MTFFSNLNKLIVALIVIALISIAVFSTLKYFKNEDKIELVIGAGSKSGEAYKFAQAIAEVSSKNFPNLHISIVETSGSKENMELLESKTIDLATVQADIEAVPSARIITNLYPDMFQLIVREDAGIHSFHDLKGKRMALPNKGGGQWVSFWFTANHYGVFQNDIENIELSSSEAIEALITGEVDAIFKVRAPRNESISKIINSCSSKLIPINQASAMKLKQPSLNVGVIPAGTYNGAPLVPSEDLSTIAVTRLLIGHENADEEAVKLITQVLFERRLELLKITPLAGFVSQPDWNAGTFIPIHKGAQSFYERENPSYFVENADFLALIMSIFLMLGSALLGIRNKVSGNKKNLADNHTKELISIMESIHDRELITMDYIQKQRVILQKMLAKVVKELDNDKLTIEGFQFFSFTWDKVNELLKEKENHIK